MKNKIFLDKQINNDFFNRKSLNESIMLSYYSGFIKTQNIRNDLKIRKHIKHEK